MNQLKFRIKDNTSSFTIGLESAKQYTGYKDKHGLEIYEGDRVKLISTFDGSECIGTVVREEGNIVNMLIIVGDPNSTHTMFPLPYLRNSELVTK